MTRHRRLAGVAFAANIPRDLDDGVLYVSMENATAIHRCMCGCGSEVVTPFARRSWKLSYDGTGVSLWPSIGNGALPCRSHYVIRDSQVEWLEPERTGRDNHPAPRDSVIKRAKAWIVRTFFP